MNYTAIKKQVKVIFEDDTVVVVSKPSGLLTIQDRYKEEIPNLKNILLDKYGSIYTVHRLDKETSGVIIFAKNEESHKFLNAQFNKRTVKKRYWAFTQNAPFETTGTIDMPIANEMSNKGRMIINKDGKPAVTHYSVVENYGRIALLEFEPETGRTHQIRVHSKSIGCPLLVDSIYAEKSNFYLSAVKRNYKTSKYKEERPFISRLTLHAKNLQLKLPSGEIKSFEAPLPKDLAALKKQLENLNKE